MGHGARCAKREIELERSHADGLVHRSQALALRLPNLQRGRPNGSYVIAPLRVIKIKERESNHRKK